MDELDLPQYFICPISLQIMKDPVTTISGITYDRESIERWLLTAAAEGHSSAVCPVTKQLLPLMSSDLTPKSPVHKSVVFKLIRDVKSGNPLLDLNAIKKLDELAKDKEKNQKPMAEAGVPKAIIFLILKRFKEEVAKTSLLESLKLNFFKEMVSILHKNISPQDNKAVLHVLIQTSPFGRNRMKIVEAGAIFEIMELELNNPNKKTTELIFCLLANLCTCADGRQQFLQHAGGIALAAKRLLRISPTTDDRALCIIESIARFSATREVVSEMLRVSAVSKLCMVLQADCAGYLKNKARDILRLHNYAWSNSPCIQVYLLAWYTR